MGLLLLGWIYWEKNSSIKELALNRPMIGQCLANAMPSVGQNTGFAFRGDSAVSRLQ